MFVHFTGRLGYLKVDGNIVPIDMGIFLILIWFTYLISWIKSEMVMK